MKYWLLLAVYAVGSVLSLHVDEGCEAKSVWRLNYKWDEVKIRFWVPPEERSRVLSIDVEFEGEIHPVTFDSFEIYRKEINHTRIREGDRTSTTFKMLNEITDGWNYLDFTLSTQYGFKDMLNNLVSSLNSSADYLPQYLSISGRYITVNCPSELRMWKVADEPVTVPFNGYENHWLSFYSNREFLLEMVLEMRQFLVGWDTGKNTPTTIPTRAKPLPAFVEHHLMITCLRKPETLCTIEISNGEVRKLTEELRVADIPKSIAIKKKDGAPFSIFLHDHDPFIVATPKEPKNGNEASRSRAGETWTWILVGIVSSIFAVILMAKVRKLVKKKNDRENNVENNQYTEDEISGFVSSSGCVEACIK